MSGQYDPLPVRPAPPCPAWSLVSRGQAWVGGVGDRKQSARANGCGSISLSFLRKGRPFAKFGREEGLGPSGTGHWSQGFQILSFQAREGQGPYSSSRKRAINTELPVPLASPSET